MPLDFPNSPTLNQTYAGPSGVLWSWDGTKWVNATVAGGYAPVQSPVFTGDPQAPTQPATDADTSVATTAFVQTAVGGANHNTGRNLLHNPLFNVAQRGAGPFTAAQYTLDRWYLSNTTDAASVTQQGLGDPYRASIGDEAASFALANSFTGNAAAGANNVVFQGIEGVRRLSGKTVTLSFWALCGSGALKLGVNFLQSFGAGGSPSASVWANATGQSVTLSTTMTRYSITATIPSTAGKTLGTNGADCTYVFLAFSSGATNNALYGNIGVQSGLIWLWGVQLEIGSVATPLEKPDPRYDLSNCQRFYQLQSVFAAFYHTASSGCAVTVGLPVQMRANPTVTVFSDTSSNLSGMSVASVGPSAVRSLANAVATGGVTFNHGYAASADL